jgi:hypothetical protein
MSRVKAGAFFTDGAQAVRIDDVRNAILTLDSRVLCMKRTVQAVFVPPPVGKLQNYLSGIS